MVKRWRHVDKSHSGTLVDRTFPWPRASLMSVLVMSPFVARWIPVKRAMEGLFSVNAQGVRVRESGPNEHSFPNEPLCSRVSWGTRLHRERVSPS